MMKCGMVWGSALGGTAAVVEPLKSDGAPCGGRPGAFPRSSDEGRNTIICSPGGSSLHCGPHGGGGAIPGGRPAAATGLSSDSILPLRSQSSTIFAAPSGDNFSLGVATVAPFCSLTQAGR